MVGVDPDSPRASRRAATPGLEASHEGVDWLLAQAELARPGLRGDLGLRPPRATRRAIARRGIRAIDLTPAAVGPFVVPAVNLDRAPRRAERQHDHLRRAGHDPDRRTRSRAVVACRTPRSSPRWRRRRPARAPATTSTSSPGRRRAGIEEIGGAERGKAIIILNPADPPLLMRDTIFCAIAARRRPRRRSRRRSRRWSSEVQQYVPGYRLRSEPQFDPSDERPAAWPGRRLHRGRGRRRLPAAVRRQPRHHDRRRRPGRRGASHAASTDVGGH